MNTEDNFESLLVAFGNARQKEYEWSNDDIRMNVHEYTKSDGIYKVIFLDDCGCDMAEETIDHDELFGFLWGMLTSIKVIF